MGPEELIAQQRWSSYLTAEETPTYGTYEQRCPEYAQVSIELLRAGLQDDELIVDVGAGTCDFDHYLRTVRGWRGKYLPFDGAIQGMDLHRWLPEVEADWYVSIETIEHTPLAPALVDSMKAHARRGVVLSTPDASTHDVLSTDPTHCRPVQPVELMEWGFDVRSRVFNPGRDPEGESDTLIGVWLRG